MFKANSSKDRLNYSNVLLPPPGYILEKAVGTTYSLDLETLTAITIILGLREDADSALMNNPLALFRALQNASEKIILFCEDGQIKLPKRKTDLSLFLEKMIIPVALPMQGNHTPGAFHPKSWILKYISEDEEDLYRFVVLSRNLTFDRSWDICFSMDGEHSLRCPEKSQPIIDFLAFLEHFVYKDLIGASSKKETLTQFKKELKNVSFSLNNPTFEEDFSLIPLGIGGNYHIQNEPLFKDSYDGLAIMSPFLTGNIISSLHGKKKSPQSRMVLFTRKSELVKLGAKVCSNIDVYTLKNEIVEGEMAISDDEGNHEDATRMQDIHAKMYLHQQGNNVYLYAGSMNATMAAVQSNVEMMIRLNPNSHYLNYDTMTSELLGSGSDINPFEITEFSEDVPEAEPDELKKLEYALKKLCRIKKQAIVEADDEQYQITIKFEEVPDDFNYKISPLNTELLQTIEPITVFKNIELTELSCLYRINIAGSDAELNRVILIPTKGIPEEREAAVVKNVFKDGRKSFIEYISYILDDESILSFLQGERLKNSGIYRNAPELLPALYEKMLKTAYNHPAKLNEIDYVVKTINDENIIPEEFKETYEIFRKSLKLK